MIVLSSGLALFITNNFRGFSINYYINVAISGAVFNRYNFNIKLSFALKLNMGAS